MKKKLLSALLVAALAASVLAGCAKEETGSSESDKKEETRLTKVTLNEVAHSIFYAPMYVAVEEDYFKDEGIDLELVTGWSRQNHDGSALWSGGHWIYGIGIFHLHV